jgi:hypothetical protein
VGVLLPSEGPPQLARVLTVLHAMGSSYALGGVGPVAIDCSAWVGVLVSALLGEARPRDTSETLRRKVDKGGRYTKGYPSDDSVFGGRSILVVWAPPAGGTYGHAAVMFPAPGGRGYVVCDSGGSGSAPSAGPRLVSPGYRDQLPYGWASLGPSDLTSAASDAWISKLRGGTKPGWYPSWAR